jgi:hypothetical protein
MGIQVKSTKAVLEAKNRFENAGLATFGEEEVTCCWAKQDKVDILGYFRDIFYRFGSQIPMGTAGKFMSFWRTLRSILS